MSFKYIKNFEQLFSNNLSENQLHFRKIGLKSLELAIDSVRPAKLISKNLEIKQGKLIIQNDSYDLNKFNSIYIIGGGKASGEMAAVIDSLLFKAGYTNYKGVINVPNNLDTRIYKFKGEIELNKASHPIPDEAGLLGTKKMLKLIEKSKKNDLIFCLISGGGSALLPLPKIGLTLKEIQEMNSLLLASGASIHEINAIRKHLSEIKGGNLAKKVHKASGAHLITLIISDVVGNDLDSIASGPTVPDRTTFNDVQKILEKYGLNEKIPVGIRNIIQDGLLHPDKETPKQNHPCFQKVHNYLIGSVEDAAREIKKFLVNNNFVVDHFSDNITGEAREFGAKLVEFISDKINDISTSKNGQDKLFALIGTGELTVTIRGNGVGGRNQEMLLSFLITLSSKVPKYDFFVLGANLDGIEGNSDAMGALVDNKVLSEIMKKNIDLMKYLDDNDSNTFFKKIKTEIITGPTGCNVNDILLILIKL